MSTYPFRLVRFVELLTSIQNNHYSLPSKEDGVRRELGSMWALSHATEACPDGVLSRPSIQNLFDNPAVSFHPQTLKKLVWVINNLRPVYIDPLDPDRQEIRIESKRLEDGSILSPWQVLQRIHQEGTAELAQQREDHRSKIAMLSKALQSLSREHLDAVNQFVQSLAPEVSPPAIMSSYTKRFYAGKDEPYALWTVASVINSNMRAKGMSVDELAEWTVEQFYGPRKQGRISKDRESLGRVMGVGLAALSQEDWPELKPSEVDQLLTYMAMYIKGPQDMPVYEVDDSSGAPIVDLDKYLDFCQFPALTQNHEHQTLMSGIA